MLCWMDECANYNIHVCTHVCVGRPEQFDRGGREGVGRRKTEDIHSPGSCGCHSPDLFTPIHTKGTRAYIHDVYTSNHTHSVSCIAEQGWVARYAREVSL